MTKLTYAQQVKLDRRAAAAERRQDDYRQDTGFQKVYKNHKPAAAAKKNARRRENFEAARWCVNQPAAEAATLKLPLGETTYLTVAHAEWLKVIVEGIDGQLPLCDTIDNTNRKGIFEAICELEGLFEQDGIRPEFDGVEYQERVAELMGDDYDTKWDADYQAHRPLVFNAQFARVNVLPLVRETVRQACLANYRFRAA